MFTYVYPYLRAIAFRGIDAEWRYGITEELDQLQEWAEEQGRDRLYLDPPYDSPIEGLKRPLESSLTAAERQQADKLMANLQDEDWTILDASVGRSERRAAEYLEIPKTTYRRRLKQAQEWATALLNLL